MRVATRPVALANGATQVLARSRANEARTFTACARMDAGSPGHKNVIAAAGPMGALVRSHRPFEHRKVARRPQDGAPPHHAADGSFVNPWSSYIDKTPWEFFSTALPELRRLDAYELPIVPMAWEDIRAPKRKLQSTFIGHACFLVQAGGWNMITDPVFSKRASPVQFAGPARYTPASCGIDDLPPLHVVMISHNHYDHLDAGSVKALLVKEQRDLVTAGGSGPSGSSSVSGSSGTRPYGGTLWVCPLGVADNLSALGVPRDRIVELDWWEAYTPALAPSGTLLPTATSGTVTHIEAPPVPGSATAGSSSGSSNSGAAAGTPRLSASSSGAPSIVCVPAQHQSARTAWDRNATLWCGYAVLAAGGHGSGAAAASAAASAAGAGSSSPPQDVRLYFSGDTGYRSVPPSTPPVAPGSAEEDGMTACPSFAQIGGALGPFDVSLLPIGAYSPRVFMSSFHASPEDSVAMHRDVRSRLSVGMHWGAFPLTDEPIEEPPVRLKAAVARAGLAPSEFVALWPGGTLAGEERAADGSVTAPGGPLVAAHVVEAPTPAYAAAAAAADKPNSWGFFKLMFK